MVSCRLQISRLTLFITATSITAALTFTAPEFNHVASWGRANGLEVSIEAIGSDLADEVAYIGQGFGMTSWTIHRCNGHLWLSMVGDWAGQRCKSWTRMVSSIEEATARITGMLTTGRR